MASPGRRSPRHLVREIREKAPNFRFFQAVRLLALGALGKNDEQNRPAIPSSLRFTSPLTLSFPASEIAAIQERPDTPAERQNAADAETPNDQGDAQAVQVAREKPLDLTINFMGMTGPSGVLPIAYTELLIDRRHQFRDTTAHRFLDLFTHRAVSLFYQAWRKHRFYLPYEAGNVDGFSRNLLDIVGVGLRNLQSRLSDSGAGIPDRFLIHYAGLLSQKPMSATNLAALVRGFFGVEAQLESFVGQWMTLPTDEQSALDGRPCLLGQTTFLGERLWDRQTKVCVKIGPLNRARFDEFMPGQPGLAALRELIQFSVGLTLDCDVALILKREDIPLPILVTSQNHAPRLGYSLWLNSEQPTRDAEDVRFSLLSSAA